MDDGTQFTGELEKVKATFHNDAVKEAGTATDIIVASIQPLSPVLTGALKRSVRRESPQDSGSRIECEYNTDIPYAAAQNFGYTTKNGRFVQGKHFFEQGELISEDQIDEELEDFLERTLNGL